MDDDSGHVVCGQRTRVSFDTHVLEAVRRVPRFEWPSRTVGDDHVNLTRLQWLTGAPVVGCEVLHRHIAGRIERFAVRERQARVARPDIVDAHPTVDVLAEIDHMDPGAQLVDRAWADRFDSPDGWSRRRAERRHVVFDGHRWLPQQLLLGDALVDVLSGDEVGTDDRSESALPAGAGCRDRRTVHLHLDEARDFGTEDVVFTRVANLASVPTVGQHDAQLVATLPQQGRDVEGLHVQACAVGREPGSELVVTDAFAVHEQLVEPASRRVGPPDR